MFDLSEPTLYGLITATNIFMGLIVLFGCFLLVIGVIEDLKQRHKRHKRPKKSLSSSFDGGGTIEIDGAVKLDV